MAPTKHQRDTTRALEIARKLDAEDSTSDTRELVQILTDMDARTGRKDPTKRKAKKAAKKRA